MIDKQLIELLQQRDNLIHLLEQANLTDESRKEFETLLQKVERLIAEGDV